MAQFDPRRQPTRLAPHMLTAVAAISVAMLAGRAYQPAQAEEVPALTSAQMAAGTAQGRSAAGRLRYPQALPSSHRGAAFARGVPDVRTRYNRNYQSSADS